MDLTEEEGKQVINIVSIASIHKYLILFFIYLYDGSSMRRSKLELYVDILKILAQSGPLNVTTIMCSANVNFDLLKEYLDFLVKQGLIVKRAIGKSSAVYANTARGTAVITFFARTNTTLTIKQEDDVLPFPN